MPPVAVTTITGDVDKPPVTTTVPAGTSKKAAFQLLSQLEQNLLLKQNVSSAAKEAITSDLLPGPTQQAAVSRSKSPTSNQVMVDVIVTCWDIVCYVASSTATSNSSATRSATTTNSDTTTANNSNTT